MDKEHVKQVVYNMSKDSEHFKNEQRKMALTEQRIERMKAAAAALTPAQLAANARAIDARFAELEAQRDLTRAWLHVDLDAFFAAVAARDDPSLMGVPFAVGGIGMISTASYEARAYGVRSAMPGFIGEGARWWCVRARCKNAPSAFPPHIKRASRHLGSPPAALKLCPSLIFVKPDFDKYQAASEATRAIFRDYDPDFQAGSLDEASLDCTDYVAAKGVTPAQVAAEIRHAHWLAGWLAGWRAREQPHPHAPLLIAAPPPPHRRRVQEKTQLTCSVGVAANRMLAKVCSDINKPNGQYELEQTRDAVMAFISELDIRRVPGIGRVGALGLRAWVGGCERAHTHASANPCPPAGHRTRFASVCGDKGGAPARAARRPGGGAHPHAAGVPPGDCAGAGADAPRAAAGRGGGRAQGDEL